MEKQAADKRTKIWRNRLIDGQTDRLKDIATDGYIPRKKSVQMDRQTDRWTESQTGCYMDHHTD